MHRNVVAFLAAAEALGVAAEPREFPDALVQATEGLVCDLKS